MTKEERLLKKAIKMKAQIAEIQENLQLIYDKFKELGVKNLEIDGVGKLTEVTTTHSKTDLKGLAEKVGQKVIDDFTTMTESTFYRTTIDKDYYKNN